MTADYKCRESLTVAVLLLTMNVQEVYLTVAVLLLTMNVEEVRVWLHVSYKCRGSLCHS